MTRTTTHFGSALVAIIAALPVMAQHSEHEDKHRSPSSNVPANSAIKRAKCPILGEPINLAVAIETADGPVFFCCQECVPKFQSDPAKHAVKVTEQRKALADLPKIQVLCPVSGDPADRKVFVETAGKRVYFCCKGCINKYQTNPGKYASALANSYTYQTKCPVMGEDIDPKAFSTAGRGKRFYYCCKGCDKKFFKDPEKYLPNLVAQGFSINTQEMTQNDPGHAGHDDDEKGHDGHNHDHP